MLDSKISDGSNCVYRTDRKFNLCDVSRVGGVVLLTNSNLQSCSVCLRKYDYLLPVNVDIVFCKMLFNDVSIYVFAIYISPELNTESVPSSIRLLEAIEFLHNSLFIILGDCNFSELYNDPNYLRCDLFAPFFVTYWWFAA